MVSTSTVKASLDEDAFLFINNSSLFFFRYEDMILALYPQIAAIRRKHVSTKEVFEKEDPEQVGSGGPPSGDALYLPAEEPFKSTYSRKTVNKSVSSSNSKRSQNFMAPPGFSQLTHDNPFNSQMVNTKGIS